MSGKTIAIVPAAGMGVRFGKNTNKPFELICGKPVLAWTLEALELSDEVDEIVLAVKEQDLDDARTLAIRLGISKLRTVVKGGKERQDSVCNALEEAGDADIIMVHDGARPMVDAELIKRTIEGLANNDGVVAAVPPKDTIKQVDGKLISSTLKRDSLVSVQTPQVFKCATLMMAYGQARTDGIIGTDDASLVESMGGKVAVVMGDYKNIKITTKEDIEVAEIFLQQKVTK